MPSRPSTRRGLYRVLVGAVVFGLLTSCSGGRIDLGGGGGSDSAASQFRAESLDRVVTVSRLVVLAELLTPVTNLEVPDSAPLSGGGPSIQSDVDYETARVRVVSVLAQEPGAEAFGVTAGSVQDVGLATARRTPRRDDGVTTPEYDQVPPGSTLPDVGTQVVLFLGAPAPMPNGIPGLDVRAALHADERALDLLAPSTTPVIHVVTGPLEGQRAPVGWLAAIPASLGSGVSPLLPAAG